MIELAAAYYAQSAIFCKILISSLSEQMPTLCLFWILSLTKEISWLYLTVMDTWGVSLKIQADIHYEEVYSTYIIIFLWYCLSRTINLIFLSKYCEQSDGWKLFQISCLTLCVGSLLRRKVYDLRLFDGTGSSLGEDIRSLAYTIRKISLT